METPSLPMTSSPPAFPLVQGMWCCPSPSVWSRVSPTCSAWNWAVLLLVRIPLPVCSLIRWCSCPVTPHWRCSLRVTPVPWSAERPLSGTTVPSPSMLQGPRLWLSLAPASCTASQPSFMMGHCPASVIPRVHSVPSASPRVGSASANPMSWDGAVTAVFQEPLALGPAGADHASAAVRVQ